MKLRISSIADRGNHDKERLVVKVLNDAELGFFAIFRSRTANGQLTTGVSDVYWFGEADVKSGDLVVVYTRAGTDNNRIQKSGSTVHFFYWHQREAFWGDEEFVPVLVLTSDWEPFPEIQHQISRDEALP